MREEIVLTYTLLDLPTAQHRAGLAGLVLVADSLKRRGIGPIPTIDIISPTKAQIALTQASLTTLLNDVYDAEIEETAEKALRKDKNGQVVKPLRVEQKRDFDAKHGELRPSPRYIYPRIVPRAATLEHLEMPPLWLTLWRDAVWNVGRGGAPKAKNVYVDRSKGRDVHEARPLWEQLRTADDGVSVEAVVASPVFIGAQATNAESVPYRGRPELNLLLHFWQMVSGVGEVWESRLDRKTGRSEIRNLGYVYSVPDVVHITDFVEIFKSTVYRLDRIVVRREGVAYGSRPRDAVLALPAEGGLQLLRQLTMLASSRASLAEARYAVAAIEVFHLNKEGKTVQILACEVVPAREDYALEYSRIANGHYSNSYFRAQLIRNLLDDRPWFSSFGTLLDSLDPLLVSSPGASFGVDARRKLAAELGATA